MSSSYDISTLEFKPFGSRNVLIDCGSLENALAVHSALAEAKVPGVSELVPAAQTVLVRFTHQAAARDFWTAGRELLQGCGAADSRNSAETRTLKVLYDGEDSGAVADLCGMSTEAVVAKHTSLEYSVAFAGFAPGFFYLHAQDRALDVPRRSSPRTAVPAGSVGLAGEFSGIYPRESPGGWQLIGRTQDPLWDINQNPPALLAPGQKVRFEAVRELIEVAPAQPVQKTIGEPALTVSAPGAQLLFQDSGRRGLTHWGVSPSGFADRAAAHEANRLVGNDPNETLLEALMGGYSFEAQQDVVLAVTGADLELTVTGAEEPKTARLNEPFALLAGQKLTAGFASAGLRSYIAVRGGFETEAVALSSSSDTLSGLGEAPLGAGHNLPVGNRATGAVRPPTAVLPLPERDQATEIRVTLGPRNDWFTATGIEAFTTNTWCVTAESNRIGVRLEPAGSKAPAIERKNTGELPSEGMVTGAIQIPPGGNPVVFLADHPVTGGYPVIATVYPDDLRLLAQSQPGTPITFTVISGDSHA